MRRVDVVGVVAHDERRRRSSGSRSRASAPGCVGPRRAAFAGAAEHGRAPASPRFAARRASAAPTRSSETASACWTTSHVHAAVVRERDQRAPHARVDPAAGSCRASGSAVLAQVDASAGRARSCTRAAARCSVRGATRHRRRCSARRARRRRRARPTAARARRSAAAPSAGPSRAQPASVHTSTMHGDPDDRPAEAEQRGRRAGDGERRRGRAPRRSLRQQDDPALAGRGAVLALAGQDQPRRQVDERAEPEQQRAEHEARPARGRARCPSGAASPAQTPPSQRPWRARVVGAGSSFMTRPIVCRRAPPSPVVITRRGLRDFPDRYNALSWSEF